MNERRLLWVIFFIAMLVLLSFAVLTVYDAMYDFLDRLVNIVLPRVRDFRGLSPKSFDGRGNYSLGDRKSVV